MQQHPPNTTSISIFLDARRTEAVEYKHEACHYLQNSHHTDYKMQHSRFLLASLQQYSCT